MPNVSSNQNESNAIEKLQAQSATNPRSAAKSDAEVVQRIRQGTCQAVGNIARAYFAIHLPCAGIARGHDRLGEGEVPDQLREAEARLAGLPCGAPELCKGKQDQDDENRAHEQLTHVGE